MLREWTTVAVPLLASGQLQVVGTADADPYPYPQPTQVTETPADPYLEAYPGDSGFC